MKLFFLDRDGTINVDHGYVHKVEDWELTPHIIEALQELQAAGFVLVIVTNQSGIARGYYTEEDMHTLHNHMKKQLAEAGIELSAVAFCVHGKEDSTCDCRKPKTGMREQVLEQLDVTVDAIAWEDSWMAGDKLADVQFGQGIGVKTVLLRSEYWKDDELDEIKPNVVADTLFDSLNEVLPEND